MTNNELKQVAIELVGEEELSRRFRAWITTLIRNTRMKLENKGSSALFEEDCSAILADLNRRTKSRFTATDSAKALISAILKKGYAPEDFYRVHEVKCDEWSGNEKMEHNLRPSTLYRPSHFDEYLAAWYKMDRKKKEVVDRKKEASPGAAVRTKIDNSGLILELNAKRWYEHESWTDLMRWTMRFPDAESLSGYEMPPRVRKMREAPNMVMNVISGKSPDWAETEYMALKNNREL